MKRPVKKKSPARPAPPKAPRAAAPEFAAPHALLAHAVAPARPPAKVKRALLDRIAAEKSAPAAPAGWRFDSVSRAEGWLTMPFPGVKMKELSASPAHNSALVLIEIAPGARFPDHEHDFPEEGLILSGDALNGGQLLRAGDYYFAAAGTTHTDTISPHGCVAVLRIGQRAWQELRGLALAS